MSPKFKIGSQAIINPKLLIAQLLPGIVVIKERKTFWGSNQYFVETKVENIEGKKCLATVRENELLGINEVRKIKIGGIFKGKI